MSIVTGDKSQLRNVVFSVIFKHKGWNTEVLAGSLGKFAIKEMMKIMFDFHPTKIQY